MPPLPELKSGQVWQCRNQAIRGIVRGLTQDRDHLGSWDVMMFMKDGTLWHRAVFSQDRAFNDAYVWDITTGRLNAGPNDLMRVIYDSENGDTDG